MIETGEQGMGWPRCVTEKEKSINLLRIIHVQRTQSLFRNCLSNEYVNYLPFVREKY